MEKKYSIFIILFVFFFISISYAQIDSEKALLSVYEISTASKNLYEAVINHTRVSKTKYSDKVNPAAVILRSKYPDFE